LNCVGHQPTLEEMRATKTEKYNELKNNPNREEYEEWFLRYRPVDKKNTNTNTNTNTNKKDEKKGQSKKTKIKKTKTLKKKKNIYGF
jgi:hypothetical protein